MLLNALHKCFHNGLLNRRCINSLSLRNSIRFISSNKRNTDQRFNAKSTLYYVSAVGVVCFGFTYAAVPLYRIFCQATSYGGTTVFADDDEKVENMKRVENRELTIQFNADIASNMRWKFRPMQLELTVVPGETALAFYKAKNSTDKPITGISTYNVVPFEAGQYFNKIQCFCFDEQILNPNEEVDMPVFFYIDPEFVDDPGMENIDRITLSYTFFEAREGLKLPIPDYVRPKLK